jgi:hypothetical protein
VIAADLIVHIMTKAVAQVLVTIRAVVQVLSMTEAPAIARVL